MNALNDYYNSEVDVRKAIQFNAEKVLSDLGDDESVRIEQRLKEIDDARNKMIGLIAGGAVEEDSFDEEFEKLFAEETELSAKLESLRQQSQNSCQQEKINMLVEKINLDCCKLTEFDDVLIRKAIECIKVMSKTEIVIIFRGGYEMKVEVEK